MKSEQKLITIAFKSDNYRKGNKEKGQKNYIKMKAKKIKKDNFRRSNRK